MRICSLWMRSSALLLVLIVPQSLAFTALSGPTTITTNPYPSAASSSSPFKYHQVITDNHDKRFLSMDTTTTTLFQARTTKNNYGSDNDDNDKPIKNSILGGGFLKALNPTYTIAYLIFLSVATYMTTTETPGASQAMIEKFIADPLHPNLGSSLFEVVFNTLGLVGLPLACLIMPGAKGQSLNPTPFLFGSAAAGYGSLGLFMMTKKPVTSVSNDDLGWFTRNVLENKLFNWALVLALANIYVVTGAGASLVQDAGQTFADLGEVLQGSALGLVSTVDLTILCLTGASLVPEDLERRGVKDSGKAYAIAASTLLFPAVGLALYSALRPNLVLEE